MQYASSLFGSEGGGSGATATVGTPLYGLIMPAYRIAGITQRAMIGPNDDMYNEAIPELNRMLGSWNCDGHKIYSTSIAQYALTASQKIYTIGPGGDLDGPRPLYIRGADCLFPTTPVVRRHIDLLDDDQWRRIPVQDIPGAPPFQAYYDGNYNLDGRGQIYLRFQPVAGYSLELYTWLALQSSFTDRSDVAIFPPGYEQALVYNLAKQLAALNPNMQNMSLAAYRIADSSLATLISLNSRSPKLVTESALEGYDPGPGYGWLDGGIR